MDTDFYAQSVLAPSANSTDVDYSQEFSPPKLKHKDSLCEHFPSLMSSQISNQTDGENDSMKPRKKAIFKIIREVKSSKSNNVPLTKDFGNYNRKEKSLGELSKRLLIMFGRVDECIISLDSVTQQLGVERRRIYDIINILESLGVVYRKGKNSYQWKGLKSIYDTIKKLQKENLTKIEEEIIQDSSDDEDDSDKSKLNAVKREKSLGLLSTGFIKLFLSWKGTISLEQAGRKLSSENIEENKIKTKIRRLYDIANVFSSLGLIKKTCLESKKPAYEWVGLQGLDAFIERLNTSSDEKEIFQEFTSKNKDKASPVQEKRQIEKISSPIQQSSNNNSNVFPTRVEAPVLNQDTIENLLCMLLTLYKNNQQPQIPKFCEEDSLSNLLFRQTPYETSKLFRQTSSPGTMDKSGMGLITPSIRKSVSIIQRADSDCGQSTEKKRQGTNCGFSLYEKGSDLCNGKRKPSQSIGNYERTVKKLHSFSEFSSNDRTATKLLNFTNKENFFGIANSNSQ